MAARFFAGSAVLATLGFAEDITLNPALEADDACQAGGEECGLELRQLRGEINSAQAVIAEQLEENKKYEVALDDESGYTCKAPKGWKTTPMNCGPTTKCCTSQPSYVAGTPHSAQARLSLYSICCPLDTHCKYDTIFVSCAGGAGKDDYSGVIAGLQEGVDSNDAIELRGEINSAQAIIAKQLEENKKYEVALDDESGYTCKAPSGWKTTPMNCGPTTKCCTSQPSYVAGTPHSAQARLSLYSICCPLDTHCKYDTIFVSCAGGAGKDDYSGVIAGLQEGVDSNDAIDDEAAIQQAADEQDEVAAEDLAEDEISVEPIDEEAADEEDEGLAELQADDEVTGGKCMNKGDLGIWKSGGKQQYDTALDHCGTSCAAGFPCTRDCMKKHGYSTGCASCMAHAVECGRDHCLSQCISNHMSKACVHCNKKACRPVMKKCSGWAVGGH